MTIAGLSWRGYVLRFRSEYMTSGGRAMARHGLLVFVQSDSGLVGAGEASPVGTGSNKEVERIAKALERMAGEVVGAPPAGVDLSAFSLPPELRFGLETALLDLEGKAHGQRLVQLLGGTGGPLGVNALISATTPEHAVAEAREAVKLGFTSLKLKVGQGPAEQDRMLVSAVRQGVGPDVRIRVDPNQAWSVAQAVKSIRGLAEYGLEYVEQPVSATDIAGLAEVRRKVQAPIAADESLRSVEDLRALLAAEAADIFVLKAARLGGLRATLRVAHEALTAGKPVVVTSSLESGIGIAAGVHLAAALPPQPFAHGLATGLLFRDDLTTRRLLPENGRLEAPPGPGLGVCVDTGALEKHDSGIGGAAGSWEGL